MELIDVSMLRAELPDIWGAHLTREWEEAFKAIEQVDAVDEPCCMWEVTRQLLFKTVRAAGMRRVLDIGTYIGFSTLTFALAVGPAGKVVSVDIRPQNTDEGWWKEIGRTLSPLNMLCKLEIENRVEFVTMDSREYLRTTEEKFDFICIDGWHEHDCVYDEIRMALACLSFGGLIFLDDVQPLGYVPRPDHDTIHGPASALQRHMAEGLKVKAVFPIPGAPIVYLLAAR